MLSPLKETNQKDIEWWKNSLLKEYDSRKNSDNDSENNFKSKNFTNVDTKEEESNNRDTNSFKIRVE